MKKLNKGLTYFRYLLDYLINGDFVSIYSSFRYVRHGASHQNDRIIHTSIGTFHCRKNTNDFQFANYYYEWGVKKFMLNKKDRFNVFIDGGACIGDYSILMSRYMDRCLAIEPMQDNYSALVENIRLNQLGHKIKTFPVALGDINSDAYFIFNPVNTGASFKSPDNKPTPHKAVQQTFDSLWPELGLLPTDKILFKLDIEGMENEAIRGARNFILTHPEITLIVEDKHSGLEQIKKSLSDIAAFEFGFIDDYNIFARKTGDATNLKHAI